MEDLKLFEAPSTSVGGKNPLDHLSKYGQLTSEGDVGIYSNSNQDHVYMDQKSLSKGVMQNDIFFADQ